MVALFASVVEISSSECHRSSTVINFHSIIAASVRAVKRLVYTAIRYDIFLVIVCLLDVPACLVIVSDDFVTCCSDHDKTFLLAYKPD